MFDKNIVLETTQGTIEIKLMPYVAPKACENFTTHVEKGYYDGILFHRVIKGFMLQGGDPEGNGTGGASIWGKPFEDEVSTSVKFDRPGLVAMANRGPNTNQSQFFITTSTPAHLNMRHTIFGEVISGYDVVQKIESAETSGKPYNRPLTDQKILKATVKK
ncbi:MAG: peptidylprolyl isomerase [Candidatus Eremiobacteraeota bacterium]|nr:peptidylprolyl isomerase [Candidatus Eremiobacteraeota bacterium]